MAASLTPDQYKKRWDYQVRQIFQLTTDEKLTEDQIDKYVRQLILIEKDLANAKSVPLVDGLMKPKVNQLRSDYKINKAIKLLQYPTSPPSEADLNDIFANSKMPTKDDIKESRKRVGTTKEEKPKGRPQIAKPNPPTGPFEQNNNVVLADNPPTIYEAIKDSNIRQINIETKSPAFDPDQTFGVTIGVSGGAPNIVTQLTPIQYAALTALKGVVRLLLKSKGDINKRINGLTIRDAIEQYRVKDEDKVYVKFVFEIADTASKDATDDYSSGAKLDSKYGEGMKDDVDKALAKLIYEREYKELENPTIPTTPKKTTTGLIDEAKRRGKEDAEKGLERSAEYLAKPDIEKAAYQAEYTKYIVEKDKKKGKTDGESGSPRDVSYDNKTPEEKEAYGKEYDKALAAYQGEKDAIVNEPSNYVGIEANLSQYYQTTTDEFYKNSIKKIYNDAYEKNRSKTSDLVKQAGYVGTYPPSETLLSGNFFGFGSELSKIVGFDTSGTTPKTDTDSKYKEGLVEFVKNLQSIIGQAKYAGYTDGRKKNAKYTTPGKISVGGKEYAIDFGKLNTQLKDLPSTDLQVNSDFTAASDVLDFLRTMRDRSDRDLESMVAYLRGQSQTNDSSKVQQILKTIIVSQKGGAPTPLERIRLGTLIETIRDDAIKQGFLDRLRPNISDNNFSRLQAEVDSQIANQEQVQQPVAEEPVIEQPIVQTEAQRLSQEERLASERMKQDAQNIINQLPDGDVKTNFLTRLNTENADYQSIRNEARVALQEQQPVAEQEEPAPEEPGLLSRMSEIGTAATTGVKSAASTLGTAVATGAQGLGTAVSTVPQAIGKSVVTGLGSVNTKTQMYNLVQQAFSSIPKYVTSKVKDIPTGMSPDDPSLGTDIHPLKRVQTMYDKEFERGYKEAVRPTGGTRRKSKKSNRITKKKQVSKK